MKEKKNSKTICVKDDVKIEETTKCDSYERARGQQDYEAMLMNYVLSEFKGGSLINEKS